MAYPIDHWLQQFYKTHPFGVCGYCSTDGKAEVTASLHSPVQVTLLIELLGRIQEVQTEDGSYLHSREGLSIGSDRRLFARFADSGFLCARGNSGPASDIFAFVGRRDRLLHLMTQSLLSARSQFGEHPDVVSALKSVGTTFPILLEMSHALQAGAELPNQEVSFQDSVIDTGNSDPADTQGIIESHLPPEWKEAFDRKEYMEVGGYSHGAVLRAIQVGASLALPNIQTGRSGMTDDRLIVQMRAFIGHDLPVFLMQRDVHEALLRAVIPSDLALGELALPFPSFVIVTPDDSPISAGEEEYNGFLVGKISPGTYRYNIGSETADLVISDPELDIVGISAIAGTSERAIEKAAITLKGNSFNVVLDDIAEKEEAIAHDYIIEGELSFERYVLAVILYINALPSQIQHEQMLRRYKHGEQRRVVARWKPRFIGIRSAFRIHRGARGGRGRAEARMHWRRGHFRRVAIGAGRAERKRIWIEPVLVNAPESESGMN